MKKVKLLLMLVIGMVFIPKVVFALDPHPINGSLTVGETILYEKGAVTANTVDKVSFDHATMTLTLHNGYTANSDGNIVGISVIEMGDYFKIIVEGNATIGTRNGRGIYVLNSNVNISGKSENTNLSVTSVNASAIQVEGTSTLAVDSIKISTNSISLIGAAALTKSSNGYITGYSTFTLDNKEVKISGSKWSVNVNGQTTSEGTEEPLAPQPASGTNSSGIDKASDKKDNMLVLPFVLVGGGALVIVVIFILLKKKN